MTSLLQQTFKYIATFGFIGYLPVAPGTFCSLIAMFLWLLLKPSTAVHIVILLVALILGVISAHIAERSLGRDSGHIVIDEFCGYTISVLLLPMTLGHLLAAFLLFRFFDILKPPPIRWVESKLTGGLGVIADDLMAGIYTNVCIQLWMYIYH